MIDFGRFWEFFFSSVVRAFTILSIPWSVLRVRFLRIPLPRTARIPDFHDSLSLLSLLFSWIFFYPQRLSSAEAPETGRFCGGIHNCIEKGLCCFGQFYAEVIFYRLYPHTKCSVGDTKKISNKFYQGHLP